MMSNLNKTQFAGLLTKIFAPTENDRCALIIADLPNTNMPDSTKWQDRRRIAAEWLQLLHEVKNDFHFQQVEMLYYENTGSNNSDFPQQAYRWSGDAGKASFPDILETAKSARFRKELENADIIFAPVQFSATAPLKILAKECHFRAASMPGFSREMIPALGVDFDLVHERVSLIKNRLDRATGIEMQFETEQQICELSVDIRHRSGHASSGLLREPDCSWNVPSGESYIVPYEGELGEASKTNGTLPVQFGDEVVLYEIVNNRAVAVKSRGAFSESEAEKLCTEPAYGNIAEIGFGVLEPFGIKPVGIVLLDEKLGLHIAFGRSDHFGGATSPESFNDPKRVEHTDRIYIPQFQNKILVKSVRFDYPDGEREFIMKDSSYII